MEREREEMHLFKMKLIYLFLIVILANFVAGAGFDNVKSYDEQTKTITITNFFGLGDKIAELQLLTPDLVWVKEGADRLVAVINITANKDYSNALEGIDFYNKLGLTRVSKYFTYKYRVVVGEQQVNDTSFICKELANKTTHCSYEVTGSHKENVYGWSNLASKDLVKGGIVIGIFANVNKGDYIEWIPRFYGVAIDEWASFVEAELLEYYNWGTGGSNSAIATDNWRGMLFQIEATNGTATNFTIKGVSIYSSRTAGASEMLNVSIYNATWNGTNWVPNIALVSNATANTSTIEIEPTRNWFNVTLPPYKLVNQSYYFIVVKSELAVSQTNLRGTSGSNPYIFGNATRSIDAGASWRLDDLEFDYLFEIWGNTTITAGASALQIDLNSPQNNSVYNIFNSTIKFGATSSVTSGNFTNTTLIIYNNNNNIVYSETKTLTGAEAVNYSNFTTGMNQGGLYHWNVETCKINSSSDTFCNFSLSDYYFRYNPANETQKVYNASSKEGRTENIKVNITWDNGNYTSINANLIYNGTSYDTSRVVDGNTAIFSSNIVTPMVLATNNINFYWNVSLNNATASYTFNTSFTNQTINIMNLTYCKGTGQPYLNISIVDELGLKSINATITANFQYSANNGSSNLKNYSYTNLSETENYYSFCVEPVDEVIYVNMEAEFTATGYEGRQKFLTNARLTNDTQNLVIYLLNSSNAYKFFITAKQTLSPIADAIVTINKYNVSSGSYYTIGTRETDGVGKFVEYLELDTKYQFLVSKNLVYLGSVEKTSICETAPCEMELYLTEDMVDFWQGYYDEYANAVAYNLSFDSTSKLITFTFIDLTGLAQHFRLEVNQISYNQTGDLICNLTSYSTSGTLNCNLTLYNGEFVAKGYIARSPEKLVAIITAIINALKDALGTQGLFFAFILIITMAFVGAWNPVVGVILGAVTFFFSVLFGLIAVSYTAVVLVFILAVIIIVKSGRDV